MRHMHQLLAFTITVNMATDEPDESSCSEGYTDASSSEKDDEASTEERPIVEKEIDGDFECVARMFPLCSSFDRLSAVFYRIFVSGLTSQA